MDRIFITGLSIETIIGIYDWERIKRQRVILDLEMSADISKAAATEDIENTLNYKTLSDKRVSSLGLNTNWPRSDIRSRSFRSDPVASF